MMSEAGPGHQRDKVSNSVLSKTYFALCPDLEGRNSPLAQTLAQTQRSSSQTAGKTGPARPCYCSMGKMLQSWPTGKRFYSSSKWVGIVKISEEISEVNKSWEVEVYKVYKANLFTLVNSVILLIIVRSSDLGFYLYGFKEMMFYISCFFIRSYFIWTNR